MGIKNIEFMEFGTKESLIVLIRKAVLLNKLTTNLRVDDYEALSHIFFSKNILTSITIWNIINPIPLKFSKTSDNLFELYDPSSAYVLTRNLFESYVNMYYLLVDYESKEEREFKYLLWNRCWRDERRKMTDSRGIPSSKIKNEEQEIRKIEKNLFSCKFYINLTDKKRKYFNKSNNWSTLNLLGRAKRTSLNEERAFYMYKLLSNYAHSESFAIMQYNAINNPVEAQKLLYGIPIIYTEAFLALTIDVFKNYFVSAKEYIEKDDFLKEIIKHWYKYMKKKR